MGEPSKPKDIVSNGNNSHSNLNDDEDTICSTSAPPLNTEAHHIALLGTSLNSSIDPPNISKEYRKYYKARNALFAITDFGSSSNNRTSLQPSDVKRTAHHAPFGGSGSSFYYHHMHGLKSPIARKGAKLKNVYTNVTDEFEHEQTPLLQADELQIPIIEEDEDITEVEEGEPKRKGKGKGKGKSEGEGSSDVSNEIKSSEEEETRMHKLYHSEFKVLVKYSIPIICSEVLRSTLLMMPVIFIGHRTAFELAAITLGSTYCNVTGWCLLIGMDSALDTLCSQAYAAAKNLEEKKLVGNILQRGFVILLTICFLIYGLWEFTEPILLLCQQDPKISNLAGVFSKYSRLGLIPYVLFECEKKLLQIQGIMYVPTFIIGSALPINAFLHYFFIFSKWSPIPDEIAYIGSPISTAITFSYMSIVGILYINFVNGKECWGGLDLKGIFDFRKWIEFLKLGVPGAIMVCNEWWAYEVCALLAGILGEKALAVQSIFSSITNYSYNIPMGLSMATTLRLGYNLGEKSSRRASATSKISLIMAFVFGIINSLILLIFRYQLPKIFTNNEEVVIGCSQILIIGAFYQLSDGLATIGNGILKGSGHQKNGALINFIAYWVIGLPLGSVLCFVFKLDLNGIWIGMATALFSVMILEFLTIYHIDWVEEVEATVERISRN